MHIYNHNPVYLSSFWYMYYQNMVLLYRNML